MIDWALGNTLVAAIAALIAVPFCRAHRSRPGLCHLAWLAVLVCAIAPPLPTKLAPTAPLRELAGSAAERAGLARVTDGPREPAAPSLSDVEGRDPSVAASPESKPNGQLKIRDADLTWSAQSAANAEKGSAVSPRSNRAERTDLPSGGSSDLFLSADVRPWLLGLWLVGSLFLVGLYLIGLIRFQARVRRAGDTVPELASAVRDVAARLGVRPPPVRTVAGLNSPVVWSVGRTVLLWPASGDEVGRPASRHPRAFIAHELAHLRRHDHRTAWLQVAASVVLWWNPLVWYARHQLRYYAELACDAWALETCPTGRREYADSLVSTLTTPSTTPALAPGLRATERDRRLFERRLRTIMTRRLTPRAPRKWAASIALLGLALLPGASGQAARSVDGDRPADPTTAPSVGAPSAALDGATGPEVTAPPNEPAAIDSRTDGSDADARRVQERARPDTVLRYSGPGALEEGARWAFEQAVDRGFRSYWIGYAVDPNPALEGSWLYIDRAGLAIGESIRISGTLILGDLEGIGVPGVPLAPILGDRPPDAVVVLLSFNSGADRTLTRAHASSFALPVDFGGRPLIWLGDADGAEAVALLQELYRQTDSLKLREDLVKLVGTHGATSAVVPALIAWLTGEHPDPVREAAADWLGRQADARALEALARAARNDPSSEVRESAAEGIGDSPLPQATDTLIRLARTLPDRRTRREAVESLGDRREDRALAALVEIARADADPGIQQEAAESIGEFGPDRGIEELADLAASHPRVDVRREAVETIGEAAESGRAMAILSRVAREDAHPDVQREAVGSLGEVPDVRVIEILTELARDHPNTDVQREAVETLGELKDARATQEILGIARSHPRAEVRDEAVETIAEAVPPDRAIELLTEIAHSDPHPDVQREAVESLAEIRSERVVPILADIARDHPNVDVQREAVERLGDRHHLPGATTELESLARDHSRDRVREEAIEVYAEFASGPSAVEFLLERVREDPSQPVRETALEALAELKTGEGVPALIEIARTHPDRRLRLEAIDLLGESRDERARRALEELLNPR